MASFTRLILVLLLIAVAAIATAAMRDAGWIAVGEYADDGSGAPVTDASDAPARIEISAEEALAIGRFLDAMLDDG
ncbi:MAG: hypothetical protein QNJ44_11295 [Rhodobacter sp.]|nr:hypothetical protein [Rhodobacter sp.]